MKKIYVKPSIKSIPLLMDSLMNAASIQNYEGEVQAKVEENNSGDFEAGSKKNNGSWNLWDDDLWGE